ncbi:MAG: PAS domain S-box protein [Candidatus Odinarchaeota archaeon]
MFNEEIATRYFRFIDKTPSPSNKERKKAVNYFLMFLDKENLNLTEGLMSKDLVNFVKFLSFEEYYAFGEKKKDKLSPRTVHQVMALLKSFFKYCFDNKLASVHPDLLFDDKLKKNLPVYHSQPKIELTRPKDIQKSIQEVHHLLDQASNSKRALLWTIYNSMASVSVVLEAKLSDLNLKQRKLVLRDEKSNTITEVTLYKKVATLLEEYIDKYRPRSDSGYIFLSKYKEKLTTRSIQRYLKNHSLKVLAKPVTPLELKQLGILHVQKTGIAMDKIISQRIQAEKALKASEARFQALVEMMKEGLLVAANDGTISYANPAFCEMLGQSAGELVGTPVSTLSFGNTIQEMLNQQGKFPGDQFPTYEHILTTKQGKSIKTIVSLSVLYRGTGEEREEKEIIGAIAIITNVTNLEI